MCDDGLLAQHSWSGTQAQICWVLWVDPRHHNLVVVFVLVLMWLCWSVDGYPWLDADVVAVQQLVGFWVRQLDAVVLSDVVVFDVCGFWD